MAVQPFQCHQCNGVKAFCTLGQTRALYNLRQPDPAGRHAAHGQPPGIRHREIAHPEDLERLEIVLPGDLETVSVDAQRHEMADRDDKTIRPLTPRMNFGTS